MKNRSKSQWEEDSINRFIGYLKTKEGVSYGITDRDVKLPNGRDFDYQISNDFGLKKAIELFRLVEDKQELAKGRAWGDVIERLQDEVKERKLKGHLVYTPDFSFKKAKLDLYAKEQADLIEYGIKNAPEDKVFSHGGYEFHKIEGYNSISFSNRIKVRSIDSIGTVLKSFLDLLPVKNQQLDISGNERILLVLNWAYFVDPEDVIKVTYTLVPESFSNVDQIFFEKKENEFECVFNRPIFDSIKKLEKLETLEDKPLIIKNVTCLLETQNDLGFKYLKNNEELILNLSINARADFIRMVEDRLIKLSDIESALWVIRLLKDDISEYEKEYHDKVLKGEEVNIVTTTRGHLCWLMSIVISKNKPELYTDILDILKSYLFGDNLYIRTQASFPLVEFATRLRATKNQDESSFDWSVKERQVVREMLFKALRENVNYPRVLHSLLNVFNRVRDLNETEAKEVLSIFLSCKEDYIQHDIAVLVLYFAIYRGNDFSDKEKFNQSEFIILLKDQILYGDKHLRSSIAWHLWHLIKEKHFTYEDLEEYFTLFLESEYDERSLSMLLYVVEELIINNKDLAVDLYLKIIDKTVDYIRLYKSGYPHYISSTEMILNVLKNDPQSTIALLNKLKEFWMNGIYVGSVEVIFNCYKNIDESSQDIVKTNLRNIYKEIKEKYPNFIEVLFD